MYVQRRLGDFAAAAPHFHHQLTSGKDLARIGQKFVQKQKFFARQRLAQFHARHRHRTRIHCHGTRLQDLVGIPPGPAQNGFDNQYKFLIICTGRNALSRTGQQKFPVLRMVICLHDCRDQNMRIRLPDQADHAGRIFRIAAADNQHILLPVFQIRNQLSLSGNADRAEAFLLQKAFRSAPLTNLFKSRQYSKHNNQPTFT